jgi:putative ABC transport system permease protein
LKLPGRAVTPEYFQALGMPIIAGRGFCSTDNRDIWKGSNAVLPAIINQALADRCFPKENALGKKLHFAFENVRADAEIVGIVANARTEALTRGAGAELYLSYWQLPAFSKHLVIRTASDPRPLFAVVQRELRAIEPTVAIENVKTLQQIRSDAVAPQTFILRLLAAFSFVACALALIGIYGVLSLSVNSRQREIAIRTAVGAQRGNILRLVLGEGFRLLAMGLVLGIGVAMVLSRFLRTFLFGVGPTDPATMIGMTLLFTAAGLMACWIPARRATKVDPIEALRYE